MAIVTVRAVPYAVMADYLGGASPLNACAVAASSHARVWIISVTNGPQCPLNVFEGWSDGPVPLVTDADDPQSLSRSAVAAWAQQQQQQAREAALTAEQRIALAVILGRRARALRALAKP